MSALLRRFRSAPIRVQAALRTFVLGTLLVALAVQATVNASQDGLRRQFEDHTGALVDVVAAVSAAPLLTAEFAQHNDLLLRLTDDKDIQTLDVLNISGQVVSSSDQSRIGLDALSIEEAAADDQHPILTRRVVAVSGEIGTIRLVVDETAVDSQLAAERRRGLLSGILGVAVLALFSLLGGWAFTRRISDLESQLGKLGDDGFPNPVITRGNDEIARLGTALNQRTERIRQAAQANARAHADLQVSETKLQLALAATADAVIEVDLEHDKLLIVGATTTGIDMQGLATTKIGRLKDLVHPADRVLIKQAVGNAIRGLSDSADVAKVEVRVRVTGRGWRNILLRIQAVGDPDGPSTRVLIAIEDVTEQRRRERSLAQADKMQAIGTLTAGIAHDFNNALAVSRLHLSVLARDDRDRSRDDERIHQLIANTTAASEMVRRLLLSAAPQTASPSRVSVADFVASLSGLSRTMLGSGVTLVLDLLSEKGTINIDQVALQQVFLNLAKNARDAMQGSGQVTIRTWNPTPQTVAIQVSDTGPGIDASVADTLFDAFVTTKRFGAGTGLGLATAFDAAAAAGGSISASNNDHGGASFTVTLPLAAEPDADSLDSSVNPPSLETAGTAVAKRILLVEDNAALLGQLTDLLVDAGYEVSPASCVADALQLLADSGGVDLILSDIGLPDGDGFEVSSKVGQIGQNIPTIFMSAFLGDQNLGRIEGSTFVQKPFDDETVLAAIAVALQPIASVN